MYSYPNRTVCAVLSDMREAYKTYNFSSFAGLIEECQVLANRMEAALENQRDYNSARDEIRTAKKELHKLKNEVNLLTEIKESK